MMRIGSKTNVDDVVSADGEEYLVLRDVEPIGVDERSGATSSVKVNSTKSTPLHKNWRPPSINTKTFSSKAFSRRHTVPTKLLISNSDCDTSALASPSVASPSEQSCLDDSREPINSNRNAEDDSRSFVYRSRHDTAIVQWKTAAVTQKSAPAVPTLENLETQTMLEEESVKNLESFPFPHTEDIEIVSTMGSPVSSPTYSIDPLRKSNKSLFSLFTSFKKNVDQERRKQKMEQARERRRMLDQKRKEKEEKDRLKKIEKTMRNSNNKLKRTTSSWSTVSNQTGAASFLMEEIPSQGTEISPKNRETVKRDVLALAQELRSRGLAPSDDRDSQPRMVDSTLFMKELVASDEQEESFFQADFDPKHFDNIENGHQDDEAAADSEPKNSDHFLAPHLIEIGSDAPSTEQDNTSKSHAAVKADPDLASIQEDTQVLGDNITPASSLSPTNRLEIQHSLSPAEILLGKLGLTSDEDDETRESADEALPENNDGEVLAEISEISLPSKTLLLGNGATSDGNRKAESTALTQKEIEAMMEDASSFTSGLSTKDPHSVVASIKAEINNTDQFSFLQQDGQSGDQDQDDDESAIQATTSVDNFKVYIDFSNSQTKESVESPEVKSECSSSSEEIEDDEISNFLNNDDTNVVEENADDTENEDVSESSKESQSTSDEGSSIECSLADGVSSAVEPHIVQTHSNVVESQGCNAFWWFSPVTKCPPKTLLVATSPEEAVSGIASALSGQTSAECVDSHEGSVSSGGSYETEYTSERQAVLSVSTSDDGEDFLDQIEYGLCGDRETTSRK